MKTDKDALESEVQEPVCTEARAAGWHQRRLKWANRVGAPDDLFIKDGRVVFIEFKRPSGGRRRGIQKKEARLINEHGGEAYFCETVEEGRRILGLPGAHG